MYRAQLISGRHDHGLSPPHRPSRVCRSGFSCPTQPSKRSSRLQTAAAKPSLRPVFRDRAIPHSVVGAGWEVEANCLKKVFASHTHAVPTPLPLLRNGHIPRERSVVSIPFNCSFDRVNHARVRKICPLIYGTKPDISLIKTPRRKKTCSLSTLFAYYFDGDRRRKGCIVHSVRRSSSFIFLTDVLISASPTTFKTIVNNFARPSADIQIMSASSAWSLLVLFFVRHLMAQRFPDPAIKVNQIPYIIWSATETH